MHTSILLDLLNCWESCISWKSDATLPHLPNYRNLTKWFLLQFPLWFLWKQTWLVPQTVCAIPCFWDILFLSSGLHNTRLILLELTNTSVTYLNIVTEKEVVTRKCDTTWQSIVCLFLDFYTCYSRCHTLICNQFLGKNIAKYRIFFKRTQDIVAVCCFDVCPKQLQTWIWGHRYNPF